ncbi:MAG: Gfo/Idh/MocA family oxidoreductase [Kiritimatiellales bacterium]|nr:Gfo/Idh/MocA family oxidoreductase [Kiritimatiellales bacterium]
MLRIGVIGLGNIGKVHVNNLRGGLVEGAELVAVAEQATGALDEFKDSGIACFTDATEMIQSGLVDAALIALPTFLHAPLGIQALEAGLHVMMEKPLACHKAEAERILAARQRDDQVIALMMNQRTNPCYAKLKQWLDEGAIGTLQRVSWIMTNWFRPEIYFHSSAWRATWAGDGGGVLMNQCPHNLDVLQWLVGMPERIRGYCSFGKYHDLDVEDEATAYLEYPNGVTGLFAASTGEAPGVNRLEIIGDKGTLKTDGNKAILMRCSESVAEFSKSTDEMFGMPEITEEVFEPTEAVNQHAIILTNFSKAINEGETLITPAEEGIKSLELAGAMIYSTWTDSTVELPLDSAAYEARIKQAAAESTPRTNLKTAAKVDMSKSYR